VLNAIIYAFNELLDIAENYYPKYSSDNKIAEIQDIYKNLTGEKIMGKEKINIVWHWQDIYEKGKGKITKEEAMEILEQIDNTHDACLGVNWDIIENYIENYLQEKEKEKTKEFLNYVYLHDLPTHIKNNKPENCRSCGQKLIIQEVKPFELCICPFCERIYTQINA